MKSRPGTFYIIIIPLMVIVLALTAFFAYKNASQPVEARYFFFNACGSCPDLNEFTESIIRVIKEGTDNYNRAYDFRSYNTFKSESEYTALCGRLGIEPRRSWPVLIIGRQAIYGEAAVNEETLAVLENHLLYRERLGYLYYAIGALALLILFSAVTAYIIKNRKKKTADETAAV